MNREVRRVLVVVQLVALVCLGMGCFHNADDCTKTNTCEAGSGGSGATGAGGVDPGCIPSQTPNAVRGDCGAFVSSTMGNDDWDGSPSKPFATIARALASPAAGPIYLCAETFTEAVHLNAGATLYGGLDCKNDWAWVGMTTKTEISPVADVVPLTVDPNIGLVIEDVHLRAKDATVPGGSSIGVIAAANSDLTLARCDIEAGAGMDGAPGESFAASAAKGAAGNPGADACTADVVLGGKSVSSTCEDGSSADDSRGGIGGVGTDSGGAPGGPGQPETSANGGMGEGSVACTNGEVGDDGAPGEPGAGAGGKGAITASGYVGASGYAGAKGKPGQGGGGGGGAKGGAGPTKCAGAASAGGASGGSGGAGGCGGAGGRGGQAGGASIGIVSLAATLHLAEVRIVTGEGGKGGSGGTGQLGGLGAVGGLGGSAGSATGLKDGCSGGPAGKGGAGGVGGGGLGGHSAGIVYTGVEPSSDGATFVIGAAGSGGMGDGSAGGGATGKAAERLKLD